MVNLGLSFASEFILTFLLLFSIFFFSFEGYNKLLKPSGKEKSFFSFGPMISGIVLMILIYVSIFIMVLSNKKPTGPTVLSGHMSPIYTLFCMITNAVFNKNGLNNIYSAGITGAVGGVLISAQVSGMLVAFLVLWIINRKLISKNK